MKRRVIRRKRFQVGQQKAVKGNGAEVLKNLHLGTKVLGLLVSLIFVFGSLCAFVEFQRSAWNTARPEAAPQQVAAASQQTAAEPDEIVYIGRPMSTPDSFCPLVGQNESGVDKWLTKELQS